MKHSFARGIAANGRCVHSMPQVMTTMTHTRADRNCINERFFLFWQRCLNFGIRSGCVVVALNNICIYMCRHTSPTTLHGMSFIIRACACTSTAYGKVFECKRALSPLVAAGGRWVIHAASSRCTRFGESCCKCTQACILV